MDEADKNFMGPFEDSREETLLASEYRRCIREIRGLRREVEILRNEVEALRSLKSKLGLVKQGVDRHSLILDGIKRKLKGDEQ